MREEWTIGWLLDRMAECTTDDEARAFFGRYVEHIRRYATGVAADMDPVDVVRANLGYIGGYGLPAGVVERFERVTGSVHPVFGAKSKWPQGNDALEVGRKLGEKL